MKPEAYLRTERSNGNRRTWVRRYLELAGGVAKYGSDRRIFCLGAVGIRRDGAIVVARNGPSMSPNPKHHAEARLLRKLDKGSTIFVARVKASGEYGMAKPCKHCEAALRHRGIVKAYYTTGTGYQMVTLQ